MRLTKGAFRCKIKKYDIVIMQKVYKTKKKERKTMKEIVLIPAYCPDGCLCELVERLHAEGFGILVVDDGSGEAYRSIFEQVKPYARVLTAEKNGGKGSALKKGMSALKEYFPEMEYFITADADGQHRVEDILRVRHELREGASFVLTMRRLHRKIPFRSKIGNDLSRFIYTLLSGHFLRDNQSGLRGFKAEHISWLLQVAGEKYDYEMNTLYYADKQHVSITTLPIDAIYIDGNKSSHFDPVKDTLRIYRRLFASAAGSFAALFLAEVLMLVASLVFRFSYLNYTVPTAGVLSLGLHLILDRAVIFRNILYRDTMRQTIHTIIRYVVYTILCYLNSFMFPWLNNFGMGLWLSFNFVMILCVPFEYWLRKGVYISAYREYKKD